MSHLASAKCPATTAPCRRRRCPPLMQASPGWFLQASTPPSCCTSCSGATCSASLSAATQPRWACGACGACCRRCCWTRRDTYPGPHTSHLCTARLPACPCLPACRSGGGPGPADRGGQGGDPPGKAEGEDARVRGRLGCLRHECLLSSRVVVRWPARQPPSSLLPRPCPCTAAIRAALCARGRSQSALGKPSEEPLPTTRTPGAAARASWSWRGRCWTLSRGRRTSRSAWRG